MLPQLKNPFFIKFLAALKQIREGTASEADSRFRLFEEMVDSDTAMEPADVMPLAAALRAEAAVWESQVTLPEASRVAELLMKAATKARGWATTDGGPFGGLPLLALKRAVHTMHPHAVNTHLLNDVMATCDLLSPDYAMRHRRGKH